MVPSAMTTGTARAVSSTDPSEGKEAVTVTVPLVPSSTESSAVWWSVTMLKAMPVGLASESPRVREAAAMVYPAKVPPTDRASVSPATSSSLTVSVKEWVEAVWEAPGRITLKDPPVTE